VLGVTLTRGAYPMHSDSVLGLCLYALRARPKPARDAQDQLSVARME